MIFEKIFLEIGLLEKTETKSKSLYVKLYTEEKKFGLIFISSTKEHLDLCLKRIEDGGDVLIEQVKDITKLFCLQKNEIAWDIDEKNFEEWREVLHAFFRAAQKISLRQQVYAYPFLDDASL